VPVSKTQAAAMMIQAGPHRNVTLCGILMLRPNQRRDGHAGKLCSTISAISERYLRELWRVTYRRNRRKMASDAGGREEVFVMMSSFTSSSLVMRSSPHNISYYTSFGKIPAHTEALSFTGSPQMGEQGMSHRIVNAVLCLAVPTVVVSIVARKY
jgi:hypothetical protein